MTDAPGSPFERRTGRSPRCPGIQPAGASDVRRVQAQYSPGRPYLLMVGTLEPRKNHATALTALARLKAAGFPHRLLVVGGKGWLFEPIRTLVDRLGLTGDVDFTGYAPDADLVPLYTGAACVLAPSLYEGVGFPVLEAMACATPVICSNVSSLPEVAAPAGEPAARLLPPDDEAAWSAAMLRLLADDTARQRLIDAGRAQAARFTWGRAARQLAALYERLLARP